MEINLIIFIFKAFILNMLLNLKLFLLINLFGVSIKINMIQYLWNIYNFVIRIILYYNKIMLKSSRTWVTIEIRNITEKVKGRDNLMKALIVDYVSDIIEKELKELGFEVDKEMLPTSEKLAEIIAPYDLLVMRVDPFIDKNVLDSAKNLKAIMVGSTGTNHIDLEYAKEKGIEVCNSPGQNANAVAELVFCKALDLYRNSYQAQHEIKEDGIWNKYRWIGRELRNKTMGIVGFGAIGRRVAEIARVFKMDVVAYDPFYKPQNNDFDFVELLDFDELCKRADIITLHLPLTPDTKNMISEKQMEEMKDGTVLINAARGGIIDEEALYKYIKNGKLGGANLDTLADELGSGGLDTQDVKVSSPLFELDRVYVTPHIGGSTIDAQDDIGRVVMTNVKKVFNL